MAATATVLGATGLVGREIVRQLLSDERFSAVHVLVRRATDNVDVKLVEHIIDAW